MSLLLFRVDDRLIHGQVVIGWGRPLGIDFIVLVDDAVRESSWEQDIYRMGVPPEIEVIFANREEAARDFMQWSGSPRRGILLSGSVETMAALSEAGVAIPRLNLGGVHHNPGRVERLPYLYLTDEELRLLEKMERAGVEVTAQDLPTATPMALKALE
jgi:mannose/fructose/N-acetylgalactosamine-specific phosphotransferase system component IIB